MKIKTRVFKLLILPLLLLFSTTNLSAQEKTPAAKEVPMKHDMANMPSMAGMAGMENMKGMVHDHKPIPLPEGAKTPQINIAIFQDEKDGFNLHISLANFELEPPEFESALITNPPKSVKAMDGNFVVDGHAHLYVNGKKISRVYGQYVHLPSTLFNPGINMIMVSLNAHSHDVWTLNENQIMSTLIINPKLEKLVLQGFSSSPIK
jgi:hypothetical protein